MGSRAVGFKVGVIMTEPIGLCWSAPSANGTVGKTYTHLGRPIMGPFIILGHPTSELHVMQGGGDFPWLSIDAMLCTGLICSQTGTVTVCIGI